LGRFEPKAIERKSANTNNYYTWLIDSDPAWSEFPKRSKSLICSSFESYTFGFGDVIYRVIPFNDAKIGVASKSDFWISFKKGLKDIYGEIDLDDFNSILEDLHYIITCEEESFGYPKTSEEFFYKLNSMFAALNEMSDEELKDKMKNANIIMNIKTIRKVKSIEDLYSLLNPDKNDIELYDYNEYKRKDIEYNEVWTDSKSLLVNVIIADKIELNYKLGKYLYTF